VLTALIIVLAAIVVVVGVVVGFRLVRRERGLEHPHVPGEPAAPSASSTAVLEPPPVDVGTAPPEVVTDDAAVLEPPVDELVVEEELDVAVAPEPIVKPRLRDRLGRTRSALSGYLRSMRGNKIDDDTWDELEEALLLADVGMATSQRLLGAVRDRAKVEDVTDSDALLGLLREEVTGILEETPDRSLHQVPGDINVWMFVGVNGVGKTTTIGKLASQHVAEGQRVVLAAADTFRAAAADQLELWAERTGGEIVRAQEGADPGSVVFNAMDAATARDADLVLVDTAGRLHTKRNLMEEMKKLRRIVDRKEGACKEVLLVIDASTGQNGLVQAREFAEAVDVTGIVLTKLDGTAKGGIVLAIQSELGIPVKVVGVGEGIGDLIEFDPAEFAAALFGD
jgi:fused signal recognition particle receptor